MENNHRSRSNPMRLRNSPRGSFRFRMRLVATVVSVFFLVAGASIIYLNLGVSEETKAAVSGDYRTLLSGNWNGVTTWEKYNGTAWLPTGTAPGSGDGTITIRATHTVNVTSTVTADQIVVESGGILNMNSGSLTVANGVGSDLDVSGTTNINSSGTLNINASARVTILDGGIHNYNGGTQASSGWAVNNGGTYVHNVNNINIPTATWGATSTIKITGVTSNDLKGVNQSFGHFIYNCPLQSAPVQFWENLIAINGNFTMLSSGTSNVFLLRNSSTLSLTIGGNYYQSGGNMYLTKGSVFTLNVQGTFTLDGGTFVVVERYGMPVMNVYGVFTINNGTFNHSTYLSNLPSEGIGVVNLYNNYVRTGGLHTETATTTGLGEFNFAKTGVQTFTHTGGTITNTVNFTVNNGAILNMADYTLTGGGSFTLSSGGGLILGSANGITSSGASGNIQVTGTRNYSTSGDYTYNGTTSQVTGNGLPATIRNLTVDNANNITLTNSSSATSVITMTNGKIITGAGELGSTNTSPAGIVSYTNVNYVVGKLRRSVSGTGSYDFPVGTMTNYEFANINFTGMTGPADILGQFNNSDPVEPSYPLTGISTNGTPVTDLLNYGYWAFTPNTAMTGGTYSVTLKEKGHTNASENPLEYCVLKRPNTGFDWQSLGTHNNNTQSETGGVATAARSDLNAFSHFAIGKGNGPLPVALITFNAKISGNTAICSWQTATEVNNDYFTLERSKDGNTFEVLGRIKGAGYTSNAHSYNYTDRNPLEGTSYYRLKQTDYDGTTETFHIVSVRRSGSLSATNKIQVIPNPIEDAFSVQFEAAEKGEARIVITSLTGTMILDQNVTFDEGKNSYPFEFPTAKPGTYVLRVINDELAMPAVKVIKK